MERMCENEFCLEKKKFKVVEKGGRNYSLNKVQGTYMPPPSRA